MIFNKLKDLFLQKKIQDRNKDSISSNNNTGAVLLTEYYNPNGSNNDNSINLFYNRKEYDLAFINDVSSIEMVPEYGLEDEIKDKYLNRFKDFIYKHNFYGKFNNNFEIIEFKDYSKNNMLKVVGEKTGQTLPNVVAEAFLELKKDFENLKTRKKVPETSVFYSLEVKKGFESPTQAYFNNFKEFIANYEVHLLISEKDKKIKSIKDYIEYFFEFCSIPSEIPILKSKFIFSSKCSIFSTGLVLELSDDKKDKDSVKFNKYIRDPAFHAFSTFISGYGFTLDRNVPWRLIADISSPKFQKYLKKYNFDNYSEMFATNYAVTHENELNVLKILLYNSYIKFCDISDIVPIKVTKTDFIDDKICIKTKIISRERISVENYQKLFSDEYWIKRYLFLKMIENNTPGDQTTFNTFYADTYARLKSEGYGSAIKYINTICKDFNFPIPQRDIRFT